MDKKIIVKISLLLVLFTASIAYITHAYIVENYIALGLTLGVAAIVFVAIVQFQTSFIKKMKFIVRAIDCKDYMFSFIEHRGKKDINTYLNIIKNMLEGAKKEMEDKERYYQLVLDNITSGVIITNQNNSVLRINRAMKEMLGMYNIFHISHMSSYYSGLSEAFENTKPNNPQTFSFSTEKEQFKISIQLTLWEKESKILNIFTVNNISSEMEYKELESWNRLTRVLTHEIMNSLTPIISISSSLVESTKINNPEVETGLKIIANTSNSLIEFVDNYRQLSRIANPTKKPVYAKRIIENAIGLFDNRNDKIKIIVTITDNDLMVFVDESQILQIVINLIKNGIESIGKNTGTVEIEAYCKKNEDVVFQISDTGERISEDVANHIFIPFFTTKQGGSGIGLSISRQIMRLHNGSISLLQNKKIKCFILTFR